MSGQIGANRGRAKLGWGGEVRDLFPSRRGGPNDVLSDEV